MFSGCTSLAFDSLYKTLYACTTSNKIFKFDCHSYTQDSKQFHIFMKYFFNNFLYCDSAKFF